MKTAFFSIFVVWTLGLRPILAAEFVSPTSQSCEVRANEFNQRLKWDLALQSAVRFGTPKFDKQSFVVGIESGLKRYRQETGHWNYEELDREWIDKIFLEGTRREPNAKTQWAEDEAGTLRKPTAPSKLREKQEKAIQAQAKSDVESLGFAVGMLR